MNGQGRHREGRIVTNMSILQRLDVGAASWSLADLVDGGVPFLVWQWATVRGSFASEPQ